MQKILKVGKEIMHKGWIDKKGCVLLIIVTRFINIWPHAVVGDITIFTVWSPLIYFIERHYYLMLNEGG